MALKEKPYAFSLASNKLWLKVSDSLDRSINIVPTILPLSRACFYFAVIISKTFCVLWFLRNPANSGGNQDPQKTTTFV